MKVTVGIPRKLQYRNAYEGDLQGPCTAVAVEASVSPADLGTLSGDAFTANREGSGEITATFVYEDGATNAHKVSVSASNPLTREVTKEVPAAPKLVGGVILDAD